MTKNYHMKLLVIGAAALCGCAGVGTRGSAPDPVALSRLKSLSAAMVIYRVSNGAYPSDIGELKELPDAASPDDFTDPWGTVPRMEIFPEYKAVEKRIDFKFTSAGPDRVFDTADDISYPDEVPNPKYNQIEVRE